MATVTILQKRKGDPAIGHLVNGFRNSRAADPKLIAEAMDVLDDRTTRIATALASPLVINSNSDSQVSINDNELVTY